jgi:hypothetical protein
MRSATRGTILRYDGTSWSTVTSPTTKRLRSIWAAQSFAPDTLVFGAGTFLAVGDGGTIVLNEGTGWVEETSPTSEDLDGVWAVTGGEAYAVGEERNRHPSHRGCLVERHAIHQLAIARDLGGQTARLVRGGRQR